MSSPPSWSPSVSSPTALSSSRTDRAAGAIVGSIIGSSLAVGIHWYYDLEEQKSKQGWIKTYVDPYPGRYHSGKLKAGDIEQMSEVSLMTADSILSVGDFSPSDLGRRLDDMFASQGIDGTAESGRAGHTDSMMRDVYKARKEGKGWLDRTLGSHSDTTEAAQRGVVVAARYSSDPQCLAEAAYQNARMTYQNPLVVANQVAYTLLLAGLIEGIPLLTRPSPSLAPSNTMRQHLFNFVSSNAKGLGKTPKQRFDDSTYSALKMAPLSESDLKTSQDEVIGYPDAVFHLLTMLNGIANGARISPPHMCSALFGLPCASSDVLNGSYYIGAIHGDDFVSGIELSVNSGGQNVCRGALTGALIGAQVGLSGIPQRYIDGLKGGRDIVETAKKIAGENEKNAKR